MADKTTLDLIAEEIRRSPLLRRPTGFYLPPVSTTDAAISFLYQVEFQPFVHDGVPDLDIRINLHKRERSNSEPDTDDLHPLFADYVNKGEFNFGTDGLGHVTYIREGNGNWKPSRYVLQPLFDLEHVKSVDQGRQRLTHILETRDKQPPYLLLRWSQICEALFTRELVGDQRPEPNYYAQLYQAVHNAQGERELWVGSLPRLNDKRTPSKNGRLAIPQDNGTGYALRLTAPFLANLLFLAEDAGVAEDGINSLKSYYFAQPPETADSLKKEIEELELELRHKRERLTALGSP